MKEFGKFVAAIIAISIIVPLIHFFFDTVISISVSAESEPEPEVTYSAIYEESERFTIEKTTDPRNSIRPYIVVDNETGVNYLCIAYYKGIGVCPLVDSEGNPIVEEE